MGDNAVTIAVVVLGLLATAIVVSLRGRGRTQPSVRRSPKARAVADPVLPTMVDEEEGDDVEVTFVKASPVVSKPAPGALPTLADTDGGSESSDSKPQASMVAVTYEDEAEG